MPYDQSKFANCVTNDEKLLASTMRPNHPSNCKWCSYPYNMFQYDNPPAYCTQSDPNPMAVRLGNRHFPEQPQDHDLLQSTKENSGDTTPQPMKETQNNYYSPYSNCNYKLTDADAEPRNTDIPSDDQTIFHRNVRGNRYYNQEKRNNIYVAPKNTNTSKNDKYTRSLYQTPYNSTTNKIGTGIMVNHITGEMYETFEEQLPPPNTTKGEITAKQLQKINPKLLHLTGGYNHHQPPPKRKEVHNTAFVKGGANPFGDQAYTEGRRSMLERIAKQNTWGNKDGEYAVERGPVGEKPYGYFGLVPRNRFTPYIAPTQELEKSNHVFRNQEETGADLTKREQWQNPGQHTRPKHDIADAPKPIGHASFSGQDAQARHDFADPSNHNRAGTQRSAEGKPQAGVAFNPEFGMAAYKPNPSSLRTTQKETANNEFSKFTGNAAHEGSYVVNDRSVRPTQKLEHALPSQSVTANVASGYVVTDKDLRETLKGAIDFNAHRDFNVKNQIAEGGTVVNRHLRPTMNKLQASTHSQNLDGVAEMGYRVPFEAHETGDRANTEATLVLGNNQNISANEMTAPYVQNQKELLDTHRARDNQVYVPKLVMDGQSTQNYTVGQHDTCTARGDQVQGYIPVSQLVSGNGGYSNYVIPPTTREGHMLAGTNRHSMRNIQGPQAQAQNDRIPLANATMCDTQASQGVLLNRALSVSTNAAF